MELGFAGCDAAPEPCSRRGKQRGLGRDMPEPRHAVNSRCRSSNSSAGSQRRAFVSWKPDGALPSTGTARPAAAPSQAQAPRDPGAVQCPALGPHRGGRRAGGAGRAPPNGEREQPLRWAPSSSPSSQSLTWRAELGGMEGWGSRLGAQRDALTLIAILPWWGGGGWVLVSPHPAPNQQWPEWRWGPSSV